MKLITSRWYTIALLTLCSTIIALFLFSISIVFAEEGRDDSNTAPTNTSIEQGDDGDNDDSDSSSARRSLEDFREQEKKRLEDIREREKSNQEAIRESEKDRLENLREMQNERLEKIREHFSDDTDFNTRQSKVLDEIEKKREEMRLHMEEKRAELSEENEVRAEERRARLEESAKDRVRAYVERIVRRFSAAVERLDKISDRIMSRIQKFEEQGKDMSAPRELLQTADEKLLLAHEALTQFIAETETVLTAEDPKVAFERVKELLTIAKDSIRNAHDALVETIRAIKVAGGLQDDTDADDTTESATSTEETQ